MKVVSHNHDWGGLEQRQEKQFRETKEKAESDFKALMAMMAAP